MSSDNNNDLHWLLARVDAARSTYVSTLPCPSLRATCPRPSFRRDPSGSQIVTFVYGLRNSSSHSRSFLGLIGVKVNCWTRASCCAIAVFSVRTSKHERRGSQTCHRRDIADQRPEIHHQKRVVKTAAENKRKTGQRGRPSLVDHRAAHEPQTIVPRVGTFDGECVWKHTHAVIQTTLRTPNLWNKYFQIIDFIEATARRFVLCLVTASDMWRMACSVVWDTAAAS